MSKNGGKLKVNIALSFILIFAFISHFSFAEASIDYGDIVISLEYSHTGLSYFGYAEYKVLITNQSVEKAHHVTLFLPYKSYGMSESISRISRQVIVSPLSKASVSLFQPPMRMYGMEEMAVVIDGKRQRDTIAVNSFDHCRNSYSSFYGFSGGFDSGSLVLISRNISLDDCQRGIENAFSSQISSSGSVSDICSFIKSDVSVQGWSSNWLSYSCYECVIMQAADIQDMPVSARDALFEYVNCGGCLMVLGNWSVPEELASYDSVYSGRMQTTYSGFGLIIKSDEQDISRWSNSDWRELRRNWRQTSVQLMERQSISNANENFAVVESLELPVRGLFVLVLLFAIIIGPVNLIILSYRKKRIWMLWTVPLISIVASLAIFLFAVLGEGWQGYERIREITFLNEKTRRSSTIALAAYYCPLTPRKGLHFDYQTEVTPFSTDESISGRNRTIDWTSDQHFEQGWVSARIPAHFLLRKSRISRERVKIAGDDNGGFGIVNGLGADIKKFFYADANGDIFVAENVKAGEQAHLSAQNTTITSRTPDLNLWRRGYANDWNMAYEGIVSGPERYLRPHSYIAIIDGSLFIEQAVTNLKSRKLESIVFGIY